MVDIGISQANLQEITEQLNKLLANEYVLYTKTLKYHWNVKGKHFGSLHTLFEKQYLQLFETIDDVAERITTLGGNAYGSLQEFLNNSTISEQPGSTSDEKTMITQLIGDHEIIIKQIREHIDIAIEIRDEGTNNFLGSLLEKHEKIAWMLRTHLE